MIQSSFLFKTVNVLAIPRHNFHDLTRLVHITGCHNIKAKVNFIMHAVSPVTEKFNSIMETT